MTISEKIKRDALFGSMLIGILFLSFACTAYAQSGPDNTFTNSNDVFSGFIKHASAWIFSLSSWLLYTTGSALNLSVFYTVFGFKSTFAVNSAGMLAAWGVLRDLANIGLIFGFIVIGLATILDIHSYDVKKTLPRLIIFAVLLNFSLLASQAVIDASNVFSSTLYGAATGNCGSTTQEDCARKAEYGPAGFIVQTSGVSNLIGRTPPSGDDYGVALAYAGYSIFMTITAMLFLAATIMLIIRAVVLVFLMVVSPIGFAGLAIPPLEKYGNMWWQTLLSQSFFAPVMLLFLVIGVKMVQAAGAGQLGGKSLGEALADGSVDNVAAVIIFGLMCGFMVLALVAAKQMGAYGADFAISMSRKAVSAPFAYPSRYAAGAAGKRLTKGYERYIAANVQKVPLVGGVLRDAIDTPIMGALGAMQNAKFGLSKSFTEQQKASKERKEHLQHVEHLAHAKSELDRALKGGDQNRIATAVGKLKDAELADALEKATSNQAELISNSMSADRAKKFLDNDKISDAAKEKLRTARFGFLEAGLSSYSGMLDEYNASLAQINNDAALTPEQKASRRRDLDAAFADRRTSMKSFEKRVRDMAVKDYATMSEANANVVRRVIEASNLDMQSLMSNDQLEAIEKDSGFQAPIRGSAKENTRRGRVKRWLTEYRTETARGDDANVAHVLTLGGNIQRVANKMSGKEKAKMDKDDILHPTVLKTVGANDFQTIIAEGSFAEPEIEALVEGAVRAADNEKLGAFNNLAAKSQLTDGVTGLSRKVAAEAARRGIAL